MLTSNHVSNKVPVSYGAQLRLRNMFRPLEVFTVALGICQMFHDPNPTPRVRFCSG